MNILETIVAQKRTEVLHQEALVSIGQLMQQPSFGADTLSLVSYLVDADRTGIIAEFKRKSPSKGIINDTADVCTVTAAYAQYASGISVLTDTSFFGGSAADLIQARKNNIPLLRKDFMLTEYQVYEAKAMGADVILLIAACLTPDEVKQLSACARQLKLETLLEVHTVEELDHVCDDINMIGVNNRSLKNFEVDLDHSIQLIEKIPAGFPAIAESGIQDIHALLRLKRAGFQGFLVGEKFMRTPDPASAFIDFVQQLKQLTNDAN